jgi:hypothetical protein
MRFGLLLLLLTSTHAFAQPRTPEACDAEIYQTEVRIAEARKRPEYRSERGQQVLSTADRWVNQARRHAAKGESRGCVEAAKKARLQISSR